MNKYTIALGLAGLLSAPIAANDPKPAKTDKPTVTLNGGDLAPELKVSRWLQGEPIKAFEPGKVYVIEFWAPWCDVVSMMPELSELQVEYKDQGVTVIGLTVRDRSDSARAARTSEKKLIDYVKEHGTKLKYTFAYSEDVSVADAWTKASGWEVPPRPPSVCVFVVDKTGRLAYIGRPLFVGVALPKVLAGTATARAISEEMAAVEEEYHDLWRGGDRNPTVELRKANQFEIKYPQLAKSTDFVRDKLIYLDAHGMPGETTKYAQGLLAKAIDRKDQGRLRFLSTYLRDTSGKDSEELQALAVKAAETEVRLAGEQNAKALLNLAKTYISAGDKAKAAAFARKALAAAAGEPADVRASIEREARRLGADRPEDKK